MAKAKSTSMLVRACSDITGNQLGSCRSLIPNKVQPSHSTAKQKTSIIPNHTYLELGHNSSKHWCIRLISGKPNQNEMQNMNQC